MEMCEFKPGQVIGALFLLPVFMGLMLGVAGVAFGIARKIWRDAMR